MIKIKKYKLNLEFAHKPRRKYIHHSLRCLWLFNRSYFVFGLFKTHEINKTSVIHSCNFTMSSKLNINWACKLAWNLGVEFGIISAAKKGNVIAAWAKDQLVKRCLIVFRYRSAPSFGRSLQLWQGENFFYFSETLVKKSSSDCTKNLFTVRENLWNFRFLTMVKVNFPKF